MNQLSVEDLQEGLTRKRDEKAQQKHFLYQVNWQPGWPVSVLFRNAPLFQLLRTTNTPRSKEWMIRESKYSLLG